MKTLYIIDGYAQFFRAYHAIRTPMTSPVTKEPTNMTFGFVGMLLKLLRGEGKLEGKPDYIIVALDVSGDRGTFRTQIYPDYKAHRPPPPDDLFPQVDRCIDLLKAIGVPSIGVEGMEADDVIATLVTELKESDPDLRIRIISKDKDLKQLLEQVGTERPGGVEMIDVHKDEVIDAARLKEETGLAPSNIIDFLALMGDTADNIPGVEGVGPKTAAQLIVQYGSLDNLMAHADEIKGKRGEKLRAAADMLPMSRELVTLKHDVDFPMDLEGAAVSNLQLNELGPILKELGFGRYQDDLKRLINADHPPTPSQSTTSTKPALSADPMFGGLFAGLDDLSTPQSETNADYQCVKTTTQLTALIKELQNAPLIALDTETTDLSPRKAKLCGLSFAIKPGQAWYVPVRSPEPDTHLDEQTVLDALRPILEDPSKPKAGQNLKYDLLVLRAHGVELAGLSHRDGADWPGCDSMVASYLIDSSRSSHGLDSLALALLGHTNLSIKDLIGSGKNQRTFDTVPLDQATPYAAEDSDIALQLCEKMLPELNTMGLTDLWSKVELPLVEVLAELEWNGILVEPDELDRQRERLTGRIKELVDSINDAAMETTGRTFNPDSPKQLAGILFNKPETVEPGLGLRIVKRRKTGPSTDTEVLEKLVADPLVETTIPELMLEYRKLTKLVNTYLVSLKEAIHPQTGRIHASFNQTVAATGRLSSSDPNLQNIPIRTDLGREIRKAFIAAPGHVLINADYSQIELRILAHLSQDPALIEAFHEGQDIHTAVAAQIEGVKIEDVTREQRNGAKMVNFGIVYGITPFGLARRLKISNTQASEIIDNYKARFAGITTFLQECIDQATRHGYVETILKRRRPILDIDSNIPNRRSLAERMAINSVVQGSAADLIKVAMVDLHTRLSEHAGSWRNAAAPEIAGVKMLLQIHDELVFEAPEQVAEQVQSLIIDRMENAWTLTVPLKVDSGIARNWFEGK